MTVKELIIILSNYEESLNVCSFSEDEQGLFLEISSVKPVLTCNTANGVYRPSSYDDILKDTYPHQIIIGIN